MSLADVAEYRGIDEATLEMCDVRWVDDDENYPIRFPYNNLQGVWYERKGIKPGGDWQPKIMSPPNSEIHMYNPLRMGPNSELVFICEGEYDTLSVIDCGYDAVGSQGTSTFRAVWGRLFSGGTTIIAFDGDAPGRKASVTLRKIMSDYGANVYILDMPDGEDLNDLHQRGELADFLAEWLDENGIDGDPE